MQENNIERKESFQTSGLKRPTRRNNAFVIALIVLNCITFVLVALFNAAASTRIFPGLFKNVTGSISASVETCLTPAGWTFSSWGIIYAWQALWLIFNVVIIFIRHDGERLCNHPAVLTPIFHILYFINLALNIVWLFVWDAKELTGAFVVLFLMTVPLYVALVFSHRNTYNASIELSRKKWVLWCYRILVNNGIAFYATWITVATNVNLSIAITYSWAAPADQLLFKSTSAIIGLSVISVVLIIYFILDIYVFEKYLRFTFSPYVQLTIALAGLLSKNWNPNEPAAIFQLVLLIIGPGIMFLTKIIATIFRVLNDH